MISLNLEKLFEFISPEGSCECCGTSCKTAFCDNCRKELNHALDSDSDSETLDLDEQALR